jgi:hypothetical protein
MPPVYLAASCFNGAFESLRTRVKNCELNPKGGIGMRGRCARRAGWTLLILLMSIIAGAETPEESRTSDDWLTLLSFNVHGIFRMIAKDDPRDRMPTIAWLADHYDIVLFQEDFEYHEILAENLPESDDEEGNGMGWDPRRVLAKAVSFPFAVFVPHFSPPYGSGISTFVRTPFATGISDREAYGLCHGWFGANGDCWSSKGWLRVRVRTPNGAEIDVYNTHLEAGPSATSIAVRRSQLDILADAIETDSADRPVIVAGDFNASFGRPGDRETLMGFRDRLGLRDSGAGPELPNWLERDYILYSHSEDYALVIEEHGEASEFVSRNRALSDHPALYIRFRAKPITSLPENPDREELLPQ